MPRRARNSEIFPYGDPLPFRGILQATLTEEWGMRLPRRWIEHFRADPPSVMTAAPGKTLNLYPSPAIHAKYPHRPESPSPLRSSSFAGQASVPVSVRANGSFRILPDLRPRGLHPPADKFAFIGQGHSIRIVPYDYVMRLLHDSVQGLDLLQTKQRR